MIFQELKRKGRNYMKNIKMLDCTLRDGGTVNNFNFGQYYMDVILHGIEESGIEIIETGYIDSENGSDKERTQFSNEQVITKYFIHEKKPGVAYVAMIDYGKFDPKNLMSRSESAIDGIRLAFHKKNRKDILKWGKEILDKGYLLFFQPMTCLRYSDMEMLDLINDVNVFLPEITAFYIVDSFGEMRLNEMNRLANLVDHNLNPNIAMGLHSHNNLQLSYSNAVTLLNFPTNRDLIFDSSIMGMGKGAGNMTTELFAEHLNTYFGKSYKLQSLFEVIDKALNQIRENYFWGYAVEYYLSAANHCTPSYASHFYKKHMLSVEQLADLLGKISDEKKLSFDREYADALYYQYNEKGDGNKISMSHLKKIIEGKKVLLIAPGPSVLDILEDLTVLSEEYNMVTIAVNSYPQIHVNYIFITKLSVYEVVKNSGFDMILTSNVDLRENDSFKVDYNSLNKWSGGVSDNATIMVINLLKKIGAKQIKLAGFDGFSTDVDKNYYTEALKRPVSKEEANYRNSLLKAFIQDARKTIDIEFLTPSIYE